MFLSSLRPYQFRNLKDGELAFAPGVNIIVGKNGQGKTNLVEAISLLSLSKSFRTSDQQELVRWGEKEASVFGVVKTNVGEFELGISLEEKGKGYYVQSQRVKSITDFLGHLICVGFSPADLLLLQGAPALRRKFLDRHISELLPAHMASLISYNRALQNKNKLLKEGQNDAALLTPWNEILAPEALRIVAAREEFIKALEIKAQAIHRAFCADDSEISISLRSSIKPEVREIHLLLKEYERYRSRESAMRTSLLGPHRDDLQVNLGGRDARAYASQGQCRSIVLALTLGVIELLEERKGDSPLVLLDDVNSELDTSRSEAFFGLVLRQARQIFVTGTDASLGHMSTTQGYHVLRMEGGGCGEK